MARKSSGKRAVESPEREISKSVLGKVYVHPKAAVNFDVGNEVENFLQGTGFENLLKFARQEQIISWFLVEALASHCNPMEQVFNFGSVTLYFGLRDILNILGLPISGKPLITEQIDGIIIANELFPDMNVFVKMKGFKLNKLKQIATAKNGDDYTYPLEHRIRAVVLYLLGSYIFPSSSSGYMRAICGRFVTKVDEIKSFSWGEAALVEIHNSLFRFCKDAKKKSSKESKAGIGGCMFALMAFAFQYIRPLRKLYKVEELSREMLIQTSFPLACRWAAKLIKTLKSSYPDVRLVQLNECLDNLKFDDIYWNPYDRNFKRMPIHFKNQKQIGLAILPIFNLECGLFHRPYVCWRQFELSKQRQIDMKDWLKSNVKAARKNVLLYCKGIKGRGNKNYWELWKGKLSMDVMDSRNQIHTQPWLLNEDVEQQELPQEQQEQQQELEVAILLSSLDSVGHVEEAADENKAGEMQKPRWLSKTIQDRPFDSPKEKVQKRRDAPKYHGMQTYPPKKKGRFAKKHQQT